MRSPDVVIIGSGPAGVSAAWPLVEAGLEVLMIDAGDVPPPPPPLDRSPLSAMRREGSVPGLLGRRLEHLRDVGNTSPKLRTAASAGFGDGYKAANRIEATGFRVIGGLVTGGLSTVWGGVACPLPSGRYADWGLPPRALEESYRRVAKRIGLSGCAEDAETLGLWGGVPLQPPLPTSSLASRLLSGQAQAGGLALARPMNAVLSQAIGDRGACTLDKACMWRCARGAIYSAADEVAALVRAGRFTLLRSHTVAALRREEGGWAIEARHRSETVTLRAPRVFLAAGVLPSTRLALALQRRHGQWVRLRTTPCLGFALVLPAALGRPLDETGYGMAQVCFRQKVDDWDGFGLLYDGDVMSAVDIAARMPLSRPTATALVRALLPALMLGLVYLPDRFSANRLRIDGDADDPVMRVEGGVSDSYRPAVAGLSRRLSAGFRRRGGWLLPGSLSAIDQGAESHLGGTLPLGQDTTVDGEVRGADGVYVVDGSVLPTLPAEHHTLTVMANADRIGRAVVRRRCAEGP